MPVVFSFGAVWRRSWFKNEELLTVWAISTGIMLYVLVGPPTQFTRFLGLAYEEEPSKEPWLTLGSPCPGMPRSLRLRLCLLVFVDFILTALWERHVVFGMVFDTARRKLFAWSKHIHLK